MIFIWQIYLAYISWLFQFPGNPLRYYSGANFNMFIGSFFT